MLDPELESIKVFRRIGDGYQRVAELAVENSDVLTSPLLPDLALPLNKIFEDDSAR